MGVKVIEGASSIIKQTTAVDRNWFEVNKLETVYYQILGKTMKKGRALDNMRAVKEIHEKLEDSWEDHYGSQNNNDFPLPPSDELKETGRYRTTDNMGR